MLNIIEKKSRFLNLEIIYEGKNITKDISNDIISFSHSDSLNEFDSLDLALENRELKWLKTWNPLKGDKIEANIYLNNWDKEGTIKIPFGTFYVDRIVYNGAPDTIQISALSVDVTSNIMDNKRNKVWEAVTFEKIAKDIAKECNLQLFYDCKLTREYIRVEQKLETSFNFLKGLAKELGFIVKLYNNKLIIFEESEYEKKKIKTNITRNNINSYTLQNDDTDTYSGVKITYINKKGKKVEKSFFTKQRPGYKRNTKRVLFINEDKQIPGNDVQVKNYLGKIAEKALREKNKSSIIGHVSKMGSETVLTVGDCIELSEEFGIFKGKYMVTKINTDLKTYDLSLDIRLVEENDGN